VLQKGLQVELQGGDGRLEFMGEVVNKIMLEPVKLEIFLPIYENGEYPDENDADENGKHQDHHPGFRLQGLLGIDVELAGDGLQVRAGFHIPVDIQKERERQGQNGKDEYEDRVVKPSGAFHDQEDSYTGVSRMSIAKVVPECLDTTGGIILYWAYRS
jgi:hypothetical protein